LALQKDVTQSKYADNRAIFNQICLSYHHHIDDSSPPLPTIAPTGVKVISLPNCPVAPQHIGQLSSNPLISDWKEAIFNNYLKMQQTGTWSAPILRSSIPSHKSLLRPRISFHVKDTTTPNAYELQGRTCANGSNMKQFIDFTDSYSPVGPIDSLCLILALSASLCLTLHVLDISNAFQNRVIFNLDERVYLSLPLFYLEWFCSQ
jgi:hypothetical protein